MHLFRQITLQKKFNIIVSILLIICISLSLLMNCTIKNLLFETKKSYAQNTVFKFEREIDYLLQRITNLYEHLLFEQNIEKVLLSDFSELNTSIINDLQRTFLSLSILNPDIVDIALVNDHITWSNIFNAEELYDMQLQLTNSSEIKGLGVKESSFLGTDSSRYLVFGKNIFAFKNASHYGDLLGSIIISIDPSKSAINLPTSDQLDTYFLLADQNLNIYPFNDIPSTTYPVISEFLSDLKTFYFDRPRPSSLESTDYLIYFSYLSDTDYYLISILDKSQLYSDLSFTRNLILLIIFTVLIFMILLMRTLLNSMIVPLNELYLFIKSIRSGNMKQLKNTVSIEGGLEIVTLCEEFNHMLSEINTLNRQLFDSTTHLYELELAKNKAEIAHLRSQINPHFLYNTLESIRGIALEHNVPQIATISVAMGKMFRYSIKGSPHASLSAEMGIIKAYLDIQLIRFSNKFDVFYHIAPDTEELSIPKMIIQPLVENAIFHGLEKKLDRGTLYIASKLISATELHITIQDDGAGIPPPTLNNLLSALNNESDSDLACSHVGVLNVHNRIRLSFGSPYGLHIESEENLGTKITLILPN